MASTISVFAQPRPLQLEDRLLRSFREALGHAPTRAYTLKVLEASVQTLNSLHDHCNQLREAIMASDEETPTSDPVEEIRNLMDWSKC
jgi:hypothetical protein